MRAVADAPIGRAYHPAIERRLRDVLRPADQVVAGLIRLRHGSNHRSLYQLPAALEAAEIGANKWFDLIIGMDVISQHEFNFTKGGGFRFKLG